MITRRPIIKYGDMQWDTYAEIDGVEQDSVTVMYNTSPAEPDVNWPGSCEVTGIYFEDYGDVMGQMTDDEIEQVQLRVEEHENDRTNPDNDPRY